MAIEIALHLLEYTMAMASLVHSEATDRKKETRKPANKIIHD